MNKYGIYHVTEAPYCYAKDCNKLTLRVRTAAKDIEECTVFYKDKYFESSPYENKSMDVVATSELFDFFQCDINTDRNRYEYYFKLIDTDKKEYYLTERGVSEGNSYPFIFPYIAHEDVYEEVEWMQESIVYQIFPERFCNGDSSINPEYVMPWGEEKNLSYHSRYGGDLKGIIDKLEYLEDLGVDVIYVTPIFKSNTAHKYNTCDYFNIDPEFGTVEVAKELVHKCHSKNIKIILDAVFNHSGDDFFAFQDLLTNQEKSKYTDWYFVDNYPVNFNKGNYYTFGKNHRNMPKFNTNNREVRDYLLGVGEYWVKEIGIDGWRLDVCDEIGHDFWREFKKRIKNTKKDAVVIGEIMHEANSFLKGDQLDGIMNYPFKNALTDFFAKRVISSEEFSNILGIRRMLYMDSITRQMWNLIDSHDTKRFLTESNENINSLKLAIAFQFTYIGIPYIYYGDEIGMNGGDDPYNRRCMIWNKEKQNLELLDFYKKLIKIRKENKSLIYGDYKEIYCKDNIVSFKRCFKDENVIIIINNNDCKKIIDLNEEFIAKDLINEKLVEVKSFIELNSMETMILKF